MSSEKPNFLTQPVVKSIFMYRNGDPYYEPRRIVVNEKRVSSFETLLHEVTGGIQAPFGAVRNIYTPRGGHRVDRLESLQSGQQYVAAGKEKFKKLDYVQIGSRKKRMMQTLPFQAKPLPQNRIRVSARFLKPIKEPCTIFVVANGDILNPAVRLLIHQRILGQFERILELITEKMGLRVLGGVRSLYTYHGHQVVDGNKLECGQLYVAVGRERFKRLPYSDLLFTKPRGTRRIKGMKAYSLPPIYRLSKQNENSKSTVQCSEDGNGECNASPSKDNSRNKEHLSSIVREISQSRILKKWKSGQSFTLTSSDNDPESKADDGNTDSETPQDQKTEEKPDDDDDDDAKATKENGEKAEEKVESASKHTSEEEVSTSKEDSEKKLEENSEKEGDEGKEDDEKNNEKEGGSTAVNEEEVKEVKEEVRGGSKSEGEGGEQGSGSANADEMLDNKEKADGSQASSEVEKEQDKNRNEMELEENSSNSKESSNDQANDVDTSEEQAEVQNGSEKIQSHNETKESETDRSSSSNSNQAEDKRKSKEESSKESKESGEEETKVNGKVSEDDQEVKSEEQPKNKEEPKNEEQPKNEKESKNEQEMKNKEEVKNEEMKNKEEEKNEEEVKNEEQPKNEEGMKNKEMKNEEQPKNEEE
ncbi:doublecortin domain-containing protein 2-like [Cololabis saira]|uniref:doublecortin domain-containing protein 2-like n=1 Tax=Cololabis saira TaxID=129043 RepID=UPI002AD2E781|nr:doublecortin domain-containing protein 2-like [Cololabis saira]